jgi:hypothetical protein
MQKNIIVCLLLILHGSRVLSQNEEIFDNSKSLFTFNSDVIQFEYPMHFKLRVIENPNSKVWKLHGQIFFISYYKFNTPIDLDTWLNGIFNLSNKRKCRKSDIQIRLNNIELIGKRIDEEYRGINLIHDYYKLPDREQCFIAFSDIKYDNGSTSLEGREAMKIIDKTLRLISSDEQETQKIAELETQNIPDTLAASQKISQGMTLEEVIAILEMDELVNRNTGGGIFIGMGVFPKNTMEKSSYTGNALLDGYDLVFENGKVISKKLVIGSLGNKKAYFNYTIRN